MFKRLLALLVLELSCALGLAGCTRSIHDPAVQVYGSVRDLADASCVVVVGTPVVSHVTPGDDSQANAMVATVDVEQVLKARSEFDLGGAAGQWIGVEQSDPGVFVQVRSDPLNDLPRSLTVDAALG